MSDYNDSFNIDPWENISQPIYPLTQRLFLHDKRFHVSINERNEKLMVIQIPLKMDTEILSEFNVIDIRTVEFDNTKTRLLFTLKDESFLDSFTLVIKDVANHCKKSRDSDVFRHAKERFLEWTELLKISRKGIGKNAVIGLWGELFILNEKITEVHPLRDAINFWIGPENKKQDFTFNRVALEVKTKLSGSRSVININSIDQLEKVTDRLYLIQIYINKGNDSDSKSLRDFYEEIIEGLGKDTETKTSFLLKIKNLYFNATNHELDEKFTFLSLFFYQVDENFPSIKPDTLPEAIVKMNYEIDETKIIDNRLEISFNELIKND